MTTYGDDSNYSNLQEGGGYAVRAGSDVASAISTVSNTGYVFDLFQADISLAVDPSYAAALLDGEGFTDIQAASVWGQYTTAYFGLIKQGKLETGQNILISAATSTAGIAAIKVANMIGAKTICTTRSEKSKDFLYKMGATSVLVSKDNELCEEIKSITKNEGVSVVYDPIGGKFFDQYLYALAQDAIIILYGGIDDSPINLDLETQLELTKRNAALRFFSVQNYTHDMIEARKFIENGFKSGKLPAIVDRTYSFEDYKQAYAYMGAKRESHGKIILTID